MTSAPHGDGTRLLEKSFGSNPAVQPAKRACAGWCAGADRVVQERGSITKSLTGHRGFSSNPEGGSEALRCPEQNQSGRDPRSKIGRGPANKGACELAQGRSAIIGFRESKLLLPFLFHFPVSGVCLSLSGESIDRMQGEMLTAMAPFRPLHRRIPPILLRQRRIKSCAVVCIGPGSCSNISTHPTCSH